MSVLAVRVQLSLIYPCQEHKEHRMYVPELASSSSCLPLTTLPFWPLLLSHPLTMRVYSSLLSWKGIWPFVDKWQLRRYREKGPNYSRSLVRSTDLDLERSPVVETAMEQSSPTFSPKGPAPGQAWPKDAAWRCCALCTSVEVWSWMWRFWKKEEILPDLGGTSMK